MNKKIITATALITLTGILAGCARSLPAANDTTYRPPVETVKPQETQAASDMEHMTLLSLKRDLPPCVLANQSEYRLNPLITG